MNYAVIKTSGKQYVVKPNEAFTTDKGEGNTGDKISFEQILLVVDGEKAKLGNPFVSGFKVEGKIVEQKLGDKVRVAKYKSKSRYRKVKGFRANLTEIMIESISETKSKGGVV